MVTSAKMSNSNSNSYHHSSVPKSTLVRSESAPPTRGYETPMPISSSTNGDSTNRSKDKAGVNGCSGQALAAHSSHYSSPSGTAKRQSSTSSLERPPKAPSTSPYLGKKRVLPALHSNTPGRPPQQQSSSGAGASSSNNNPSSSPSRYFHPTLMYSGGEGGNDKNKNNNSNDGQQHCSLAMSRTESIMVSSSGDVIVCRCRRSSVPFIPTQSRDPLDNFNRSFPCCDTDILSAIDGPWSPVFDGLASVRKKNPQLSSSSSTSGSTALQFLETSSTHTGAVSTYEWEKNGTNNDDRKTPVLDKIGLNGGQIKNTGPPVQTASGAARGGSGGSNEKDQTANNKNKEDDQEQDDRSVSTPPVGESDVGHADTAVRSPTGGGNEEEKTADESDQTDEVRSRDEGGSTYSWENNISEMLLSLPSFDYSHIHNGQNDMVPTSDVPEDKENSTSGYNYKSNTMPIGRGSRRKSSVRSSSMFPTISESPEEKKDDADHGNDQVDLSVTEPKHTFFHGVPLFLSSLSQVRIAKVSAHPLGAHVLMISAEAMLFTYGLNNHGQLGIGFKSPTRNAARGFHVTPTLITPLLENGGKAINCAAGVDHSLVVVSTEGRRLQKLQTQPGVAYSDHGANSLQVQSSPIGATIGNGKGHFNDDEEVDERFHFSETSVQHHQVYGFGRNNFMKLGLVSPFKPSTGDQTSSESVPADKSTAIDQSGDVVLPRRVALHCTVWPQEDNLFNDKLLPPQGVFDIAASAEHSAALIRRPTGDVEVYMWGNSSLGALGLPIDIDTKGIRGEIARKPTFKKSAITPFPTVVEKLCHRSHSNPSSPFPMQLSLGPYCSFVVMSNGKCMSFGFSAEGMLGQAYNTTHTMEPQEVFLPPDASSGSRHRIRSVSAGAFHVVALTEEGDAFSWGINSNDRLGLGVFDLSALAESLPDKKENLVVIEWVPQKIDIFPETALNSSRSSANKRSTRISYVCAGYDGSIIVTESGQTLSFGKKSGRLGRGELSSNVNTPQPLYGGLHLFHQRKNDQTTRLRRPKHLNRRAASTSILNTTL